jgi:hypothetical protein
MSASVQSTELSDLYIHLFLTELKLFTLWLFGGKLSDSWLKHLLIHRLDPLPLIVRMSIFGQRIFFGGGTELKRV